MGRGRGTERERAREREREREGGESERDKHRECCTVHPHEACVVEAASVSLLALSAAVMISACCLAFLSAVWHRSVKTLQRYSLGFLLLVLTNITL